jgi:hypothetical protein
MIPKQNIIYLVPTLKNHAVPAWQAMKSYLAPFGNIKMDKNDWIIENEDN